LQRLALEYRISPNWHLYGQGEPAAIEEDSIELLEQESATGHGREVEDNINTCLADAYVPRYSGNELEGIKIEGRIVAWYHRA